MKSQFRPPKDNPLLIRTVYLALPWIMQLRGIIGVKLPDADWGRLERLQGSRCIISANHPTGTDPLIAMHLARRLHQYFNFVATRELFDGPYGWLIQRLGVYSIIRGAPDRDSLETTRQLLTIYDHKVAIFPEGETYYHNDITLPFHSGVVQLGFWVLADLVKLGKAPQLPILPVALKYRFVDDPLPEIRLRLSRLERAVGLDPSPDRPPYGRLVAVGEQIVAAMEREYRLHGEASEELDARIERIKAQILSRVAAGIGAEPPEGPLPERMRQLFNAVSAYATEFIDAESGYDRRLHQRRTEQARPLYADLWRLHNCVAITGHYIRDYPTYERFCEVLSRLEEEVLGHTSTHARREALVRIADAIKVEEWLDEYRSNRRGAVEATTRVLEQRVVTLLRDLWQTGHPLPDPCQV